MAKGIYKLVSIIFLLMGCSTSYSSSSFDEQLISSNEISSYISEESEESILQGDEENMKMIDFSDISTINNVEDFANEIKNSDETWNNDAKKEGMIVSPYFTLFIMNEKLNVIGTRSTYGIHSFAFIDISCKNNFANKIRVKTSFSFSKIDMIPSDNNRITIISNSEFEIDVLSPENVTFIFDEEMSYPLTLFISNNQKEYNNEYTVKYIEPGDHKSVAFDGEQQCLYFKKGVHYVPCINMLNNTSIYFEAGTRIIAKMPNLDEEPVLNPDWANKIRWNAFINAQNVENISIYGKGIIDFSQLDFHARLGMFFEKCRNVKLEEFMLNNSSEWTLEVAVCDEVIIKDVKIFGYRQNSDGIAIVDSSNCLIEHCFARSGDDLFEVKSMYPNEDNKIENIVFKNCIGWPDKCRGMGIIHETKRDITNVRYIDCSICFAPATWMDQLGAIVVIVANDAQVSNISFTNIKIYNNSFYPINITCSKESKGIIDDIRFENIYFNNSKPIRICNDSENGIVRNIYFDDINLKNEKLDKDTIKLHKTGPIGKIVVNGSLL